MTRLAPDLTPILDLELALGNKIAWTAAPAGTECPFGIGLEQPLHFDEIERRLVLPASIVRWSSDDPHYDIEAGFRCERTRHAIAGPIPRAAPVDTPTGLLGRLAGRIRNLPHRFRARNAKPKTS